MSSDKNLLLHLAAMGIPDPKAFVEKCIAKKIGGLKRGPRYTNVQAPDKKRSLFSALGMEEPKKTEEVPE